MLKLRSGFLTVVKQKNHNVIETHGIIHREALASRTMSPTLTQALDCAIRVVNYIKASALNSRLFRKFCQDMDGEYDSLLYHTSVRWLSKENMLFRQVGLLPEVSGFLDIQHKNKMKKDISDEILQKRLAFLADIFTHSNELNRKLQGAGANISLPRDNIFAFITKLQLWKAKIQFGQKVTAFSSMNTLS